VLVSLASNAPSLAVRRNTYTPSAPNVAGVLAAWALPKVTVSGPLSLDQVIVTALGGLGKPSSVTVPVRVTWSTGSVIV